MTRIKAAGYLHWVGLACVLLLAAYLRMGQPGMVEYKRDEANLSQLALDLAHGRSFPLLGIGSSVGLPNAPVNVYLLALPYAFSSSPQVATQFIGLLNLLAIALTYYLARSYIGGGWALLLTLLFAVNPWALVFSRKIWAQNMLPLFVVITAATGIIGFIRGQRWAQAAHLPLLVLTGQIHYGAFVMIPLTLYVLWQGRKRLSRPFWFSLLLALLLVIPYGIGIVQATLQHPDVLRLSASGGVQQAIAPTFEALRSMALLLAGTEIHALAGAQEYQNYLNSVPAVAYPLMGLLAWALLLAALWLLVRALRHRDARTPVDIALLIWLVSPVLAFSLTWTPFFVHYLIPFFPAAYLVLGFALHDLWQALRGRWRWLIFGGGGVALAGILILQVWLWLALLSFLSRTYTPDGFGTPLYHLLEVRDAITAQNPGQVIASVGGQALIYDDEPSIWNTLLYEVPLVRFEDAATQVYPMRPALYLTRHCEEAPQRFYLREGEGCYGLGARQLADFDADAFTRLEAGAGRFALGVQVMGYHWQPQPQPHTCLTLWWRVQEDMPAPLEHDYMFAVKFYDAAGDQVAQADGLSWLSAYWQPGDTVLRQFCLSQPVTGITGVSIGLYRYDGERFYNVDVLDAMGQAAGQTFEITLTN